MQIASCGMQIASCAFCRGESCLGVVYRVWEGGSRHGGQKGVRNYVLVIVFFSSVINRGVLGPVNA